MRWAKWQCELLLKMKRQRVRTSEIAAHFEVSERAIDRKYCNLCSALREPTLPKRKRGRPVEKESVRKAPWQRNGERWSAEENEKLIAGVGNSQGFGEIGAALNRSHWACKVQYNSLMRGTAAQPDAIPSIRTSREAKQALADQARASRTCHASLTAEFFGDPLPGRSALDKRLAGTPDAPEEFDRRYIGSGPKITLATLPEHGFAAPSPLANGADSEQPR